MIAQLAGHLWRLPRYGLIAMAKLYQVTLSPLIGGQCKYLPTCSNYFIEAVRKKGAVVGGAMGIWRILRCHPWAAGGYDPVTPTGSDAQAQSRGEVPSSETPTDRTARRNHS